MAKVAAALCCLYFFVCSLSFLSTAFRLLSGRENGKIFANAELLQGSTKRQKELHGRFRRLLFVFP